MIEEGGKKVKGVKGVRCSFPQVRPLAGSSERRKDAKHMRILNGNIGLVARILGRTSGG